MLQQPLYTTPLGGLYVGDSLDLMSHLENASVDLAFTSPPFALQRPKEYGNESQDDYVSWLLKFTEILQPALKDTGSLVIDLGGAYSKGIPSRSLHQYDFLLRVCREQGYHLAEEFFWHNPAKLPSPIEWVNKRKIRVKDSVNTLWWLSKSPWPKADVKQVLVPYSDRMLKLFEDAEKFYSPALRPSGHDIGRSFGADNGGAIPSNLLSIANTESTSSYLKLCKMAKLAGHPARFPERLPEFFIKMLTSQGDLVLDFFAGSNTTGSVAERLGRKWISFELSDSYGVNSSLRFMGQLSPTEILDKLRLLIEFENSVCLPGITETTGKGKQKTNEFQDPLPL